MNSMTVLSLRSFRYYLRYYPNEAPDATVQWWYNQRTGEVVHSDIFHSDVDQPWLWVPIPLVDVITLEKDFLKSKGLSRILSNLIEAPHKDFDVEFKIYVDNHGLNTEWHFYEANALENATVVWCNEHHIKYQK